MCNTAGVFRGDVEPGEITRFCSVPAEGLFRVSGEGGKPEAVTTVGQGETGHYWPQFLPDGRHYLYTAWTGDGGQADGCSWERTRIQGHDGVLAAESNAGYAGAGLCCFTGATRYTRRRSTGRSRPCRANRRGWRMKSVSRRTGGGGDFAVTPDGVLAYFQNRRGKPRNTSDISSYWYWGRSGSGGGVMETPETGGKLSRIRGFAGRQAHRGAPACCRRRRHPLIEPARIGPPA